MPRYIICLLILLSVNQVKAQSLNKMLKNADHSSVITIAKGDSVVVANLYNKEKAVQTSFVDHYYWYAQQKIKVTQGAYEGRLLHGDYSLFNRDKDFLEKGLFKKGLKTGKWVTWYENGNIQEITNWRNGKKSGKFIAYYPNENVKAKGRYKRNQLKGKVINYKEDGTVEKDNVEKKDNDQEGKSKRKIVNLFKKKDKKATKDTEGTKQSEKKKRKSKIDQNNPEVNDQSGKQEEVKPKKKRIKKAKDSSPTDTNVNP